MNIEEAATRLAQFTNSLPDFRRYQEHEIERYDHMGAAIADAVLLAQRDYDTVVTPRTERILKKWPEAKTVTAVLECLKSVTPEQFLDWRDNPASANYLAHRVRRFCEILSLFRRNGVDTMADLKAWLGSEEHSAQLGALFGVGLKTTEYMKILVGAQTVAPDTRLRGYLASAGIPPVTDEVARQIISRAADLLSMSRSCFDHSIWQYIGGRKMKQAKACE